MILENFFYALIRGHRTKCVTLGCTDNSGKVCRSVSYVDGEKIEVQNEM